ncbi:hypothetical protein SAMN02745121_07913 [Nannocystis exedens]|uniref:Uncharacterized protein n=1 Tax=Nannocystis exedens TaxID=54 RepID=A0A1I2HGX9_9BACT|nr:hypothetical protein [Nannocystis exedens]PCC67878.1 hypothetical protein NAEX_00886 [Nannocystis exedens]SFF28137.1 hypothetical protein SAMN02745121_07913 [Nannocystis exedens]
MYTFQIYIQDVEPYKGGTIRCDDGLFPSETEDGPSWVPANTHAIRFLEVADWLWSKNGIAVDPPTLPNKQSVAGYWEENPPEEYPDPYYTVGGGPLGQGNKPFIFDPPLLHNTQWVNVLEKADTLVIQIYEDMRNVRFLGAGEEPVPPPRPVDPSDLFTDKLGWDPCAAVPEFCEPEPVPWDDAICIRLGFYELCPKKDETSRRLVQVRDISAAVVRHLETLRALARADVSDPRRDAEAAFFRARERICRAQQYGRLLAEARAGLLEIIRRDARTLQSLQFATDMSIRVDLGLHALARCAREFDGSESDLRAPLRAARAALDNFSTALLCFQRLHAWALPNELRAGRRT